MWFQFKQTMLDFYTFNHVSWIALGQSNEISLTQIPLNCQYYLLSRKQQFDNFIFLCHSHFYSNTK
jgi:hypothetical protein